MEWMTCLRTAIGYIEEHLLEDIGAKDVAEAVHMSPFYLQKGFRILTGYSIGGYIRCRRLYLAALELCGGAEVRIIDLAARYSYDTPDSFTKAFRRFHGVTPAQVRQSRSGFRPFLPLRVAIQVQGGADLDVTLTRLPSFQVVGFAYDVPLDRGYETVPGLWDKWNRQYPNATGPVGEFGICVEEEPGADTFRYLIAGRYGGGPVPEGMTVYAVPAMEWAQFRCQGPMPGALQAVNTKIFREWLPGNREYAIAAGVNIEWYSRGDMTAMNYESQIWIPVRRAAADEND